MTSSGVHPLLVVVLLSWTRQLQGISFDLLSTDTTTTTPYRVGVFGHEGPEQAYEDYNATFHDYLTRVVGPQFDPPLTFEVVPIYNERQEGYLDFLTSNDADGKPNVDFLFVHTGAHSCMESEIQVKSLATVISQRTVEGETYALNAYGGVIFTLADRHDIHTLADLRNKTTACVSLTNFGSGQVQFRDLMDRGGLHPFQDVQQLVFMEEQDKVVNAVIQGRIDAGYVRTDQLEQTMDERTKELVDLSLIKVLEPQENLTLDDGITPFPFPSTSILYPEWAFSALPHVSDEVVLAVQQAIFEIKDRAALASPLLECFLKNNCDEQQSLSCRLACYEMVSRNNQALWKQQCEADPVDSMEAALLAKVALEKGNMAGWSPPASYMQVRTLQEDTGLLQRTPSGPQCVRVTNIQDAISCPEGHFQRDKEEMEQGCHGLGLNCYGYQCLCKPCVKAFEVDFFAHHSVTEFGFDPPSETHHDVNNKGSTDGGSQDDHSTHAQGHSRRRTLATMDHSGHKHTTDAYALVGRGCGKFDICGEVQQDELFHFRAIDNLQRDNATFVLLVYSGSETSPLPMTSNNPANPYMYDSWYHAVGITVGEHILEVRVNNEQISQSPFRINILPRDCSFATTGYSNQEPNPLGTACVCKDSTVQIGDSCFPVYTIVLSVVIPVAFLMAAGVVWYVRRKQIQADAAWRVHPSEIQFEDPPKQVGQGAYGLVLEGSFRGTRVAVKRALPPKPQKKKIVPLPSMSFTLGSLKGSKSNDRIDSSVAALRSRLKGLSEFPMSSFDVVKEEAKDVEAQMGNSNDESGSEQNIGMKPCLVRTSIQLANDDLERIPESSESHTSALTSLKRVSQTTVRSRGSMEREFIREMRLLSKLRHPCITTCMGAVIQKGTDPMMILELMELGSLYDLLHNDSMVLEGETILPILQDIARGVRYLHATPIIHGDLKSSNVLVDSRFRAKVSDFGLSHKKTADQGATGTPFWMSPELLRKETTNTTMSDMYAFGILLCEVVTRKDPYFGEPHRIVLQQVADKEVNRRPKFPEGTPKKTKELIRACVRGEPEERPSIEEVDVRLRMFDPDDIESCASARSSMRSSGTNALSNATDLLSHIFPQHIADALRKGDKVEPEPHDSVTVYFSDIVNYTTISSTLTPQKVSSLLDRLYTKFDHLCDILDVFKVETVGDAYMTVTNIESNQPDHVLLMARFALEAVRLASETLIDEDDPSKGYVRIRCGFNSGPVVSHVVGHRNPRYSIIGDTVNTASRMESNSKPGRIQCSEASALLIQERPDIATELGIKVICRGEYEIKGKGEMTLYWVCSEETDLAGLDWSSFNKQDSSSKGKGATNKGKSPLGLDGSGKNKQSNGNKTGKGLDGSSVPHFRRQGTNEKKKEEAVVRMKRRSVG